MTSPNLSDFTFRLSSQFFLPACTSPTQPVSSQYNSCFFGIFWDTPVAHEWFIDSNLNNPAFLEIQWKIWIFLEVEVSSMYYYHFHRLALVCINWSIFIQDALHVANSVLIVSIFFLVANSNVTWFLAKAVNPSMSWLLESALLKASVAKCTNSYCFIPFFDMSCSRWELPQIHRLMHFFNFRKSIFEFLLAKPKVSNMLLALAILPQ